VAWPLLRVLLLARIVSRVDVVDAARPGELNLDDRLFVSCPNIVRMLCRWREKGTRRDYIAFIGVELFAHAEAEAPADHGDVFGIGMSVRRNLVIDVMRTGATPLG
jgi:hypothetical protein